MNPTPIDLDLALTGYLNGPNGGIRHVEGIEDLAREAILRGCILYWLEELPRLAAGAAVPAVGLVLLCPWVYDSEPWWIRDVISHEIGHHVVGGDEERTRHWQESMFGEAIQPLEACGWPA